MSSNGAHSGFVHLHNHTNFSLLDGATRIDQLMARCSELGMHSVALTDHGNMFGAIQFYQSAKARDIKPILGMEAYMAPGSRTGRTAGYAGKHNFHQLLLAKNARGYRNLMRLSSIGYLEGFYHRPRIDREALAAHADGLIGTTSCLASEVSQVLMNGDYAAARTLVGQMVEIFGRHDYYVELQDQGLAEQRRINPHLVRLAQEFGLRLVGTNDCHYLRREDSQGHDVLLCIQTGKGINDPNRLKFPNDEFYVKSQEEMGQVFAEVPQALTSTEEIAERCDVELDFDSHHLPHFPVPKGFELGGYFERVVRAGFEERMRALGQGNGWRGAVSRTEYEQRLDYEISVIEQMGFPGYFLIVWDFIRFAREQTIPVGPGRGSAAGSLVAYSLGITDIDPLEYGLVFERFLNPERISMPDIDIDFCMRRRGEVIEYVANKYGRDKVAHIITFGTMAAKAAIRDVGRTLEMPFGDVDRIAKMIPSDLGATIRGALQTEDPLKAAVSDDEQVARLVDLAEQVEGQLRHASTHAAGIVISDEPLTEYVPLYKPASGQGADQDHFVATQYPMNDVEAIGLLKMDFLGLRTLTLVHDCLASISREHGEPFGTGDIPLDDDQTYALFAAAGTSGIFQFESSGMRDYLRKLNPSRINDLIAMNALYRPGPIGSGMIDEYIQRKHDPTRVQFVLPELEPMLRETYGIIVYQEQAMQIASALAGFSLGQADVLRQAMGKKKPEVMAAMEEQFLGGCRANSMPKAPSKQIWDQIVEFAGYGFNKSHSAAYALLAYQTGYLKANYSVHFMAALLTTEQSNTDKVVRYINECRGIGIDVLPPTVNQSNIHFTPVGEAIRFGLAAIKGVGEGAVLTVLDTRNAEGRFQHLLDFCERVDLARGINKKTLESLIKSGAMDGLLSPYGDLPAGTVRAVLMAQLEPAMESGQRLQRDRRSGQGGLFDAMASGGADDSEPQPMPRLPDCDAWSDRQVLNAEKEALGFYVTGHPLQRHADKLRHLADTTTADLASAREPTEVAVGGLIVSVRNLKTRKGDPMAVLVIEDLFGHAEVVVFPKVFEACRELLVPDDVLLFRGRAEAEDDTARMVASEILPFDQAEKQKKERPPQTVEIAVDLTTAAPELPVRLVDVLQRHRGNIPVRVSLVRAHPEGFRASISPNRYLFVDPTASLVQELEALVGSECVRLRV